MKAQTGQTLIETMVAIFIMVMGITAALGLASYSLNASTSIQKQIVGIGLAREGIEAVKNIRDTNWLNGTLSTDCFNFSNPASSTGLCYRDWLNAPGGYNFQLSTTPKTYQLSFDSTLLHTPLAANDFWVLTPKVSDGVTDYWQLSYSTDPYRGFYQAAGALATKSGFYRKITIAPDTNGPFSKQTGGSFDWPRLLVTSEVWWTDKKCPASLDWPGLNKCSIRLQTYLTNWKTY